MKVSVTLHTQEPPVNGNQRTFEARYAGFNRAYATLDLDKDGNGMCKIVDLEFPEVQADPDAPYTHFSIGVCEGVEAGTGGSIILTGPLDAPCQYLTGTQPIIADQLCGVYATRIAEMRADGRMGPND